jgi:hypothetical protein
MILGRHLVDGKLGQGVHGFAAEDAHLDRPHLFEVARNGGLGGLDVLVGQKGDQVGLTGDSVTLEEPGDPVLTLGFSELHAPPP